jgi:hypothetical protein
MLECFVDLLFPVVISEELEDGLMLGLLEGLKLGNLDGRADLLLVKLGLKLGHSEGAVVEQIEGAVEGPMLGLLEGLKLGVFEGFVDLLLVQLGFKLGLSEGFKVGGAVYSNLILLLFISEK